MQLLIVLALLGQEKPLEETWEGYIWKDSKERLRIGRGVIAKGVAGGRIRIIDGDLANALKPHAGNQRGEFYFWNSSWIGEKKRRGQDPPRVLVRLKGPIRFVHKVTLEELRATLGKPVRSPRDQVAISKGRIEWIEFLSQEWLDAWQAIVDKGGNPWWPYGEHQKLEADKDRVAKLIPEVVEILSRMKKLSQVDEAIRKRAHATDSKATAVNYFQTWIEAQAHWWLLRVKERYKLGLDLERLGEALPSPQEVRTWFLEAKTKEGFLKKVGERWHGDLNQIELWYYHSQPGQTTLKRVRLRELQKTWSSEDFSQYQKVTKRFSAMKPPKVTTPPKPKRQR